MLYIVLDKKFAYWRIVIVILVVQGILFQLYISSLALCDVYQTLVRIKIVSILRRVMWLCGVFSFFKLSFLLLSSFFSLLLFLWLLDLTQWHFFLVLSVLKNLKIMMGHDQILLDRCMSFVFPTSFTHMHLCLTDEVELFMLVLNMYFANPGSSF